MVYNVLCTVYNVLYIVYDIQYIVYTMLPPQILYIDLDQCEFQYVNNPVCRGRYAATADLTYWDNETPSKRKSDMSCISESKKSRLCAKH